MERTSRRNWYGAPRRPARVHHSSSGGVLVMARRRSDRRMTVVTAAVLAIFLLVCLALFVVAGRLLTTWKGADRPGAGKPNVQVNAMGVAPAPGLRENARPVNILLLGSDQRGEDHSYRTDVIVLVSIDMANQTASAVSFPRDLWVESPILYGMKINMIQAIGGFDATAEVFESNFGVRPDYYVLTNFSGFTHLIDSLGGIDVHLHQPLTDSCDLPQAQGGICALDEGVLPMDGQTALWYVRSRGSTSDIDRLRRAQEVVQAVFERMMSLDALAHLPKFYNELSQDTETNLTLGSIAPLAPAAVRLFQEPDRIHRYVINEEQAYPMFSWDGMWILMPEPEAVRALLEEAGIRLINQ